MSDRFDVLDTPIAGVKVLQRKPLSDGRGYLERMFCTGELQSLMPAAGNIAQINHTMTTRPGVVRGLHFQYPPHSEAKLVSCLRGEVFDVAVDVRRGSPTFLLWHAEILSEDNHKTLVIPEGCAHGFQTLTGNCEMLYLHTAAYRPGSEGGLNSHDPTLNIRWPVAVAELSARDAALPLVTEGFTGVPL